MFRDEKLEMKVGLFLGIGIFLMFLIVFSVSDLYLLKKGYNIQVIFGYVNGIGENAPVRLAGVHVGKVKNVSIIYDNDQKVRVCIDTWIEGNIRIRTDAVARINTLGLLGEQYLEIFPGTTGQFLEPGDELFGNDPMNVSQQMEEVSKLAGSVTKVFTNLSEGRGTIGKLLTNDELYNNLVDFTSDIKAHPWKLMYRGSGRKRTEDKGKKSDVGIQTRHE